MSVDTIFSLREKDGWSWRLRFNGIVANPTWNSKGAAETQLDLLKRGVAILLKDGSIKMRSQKEAPTKMKTRKPTLQEAVRAGTTANLLTMFMDNLGLTKAEKFLSVEGLRQSAMMYIEDRKAGIGGPNGEMPDDSYFDKRGTDLVEWIKSVDIPEFMDADADADVKETTK